jgi:LmbE family N-acetylglucosaminyl deacetylase
MANRDNGKMRVVVFGAHPDDPESGCGGLITMLTQAGHEVIVGYATCFRRGRQIGSEPEGVVRRREAVAACKVMGATPKFFDYAHDDLTADPAAVRCVSAWLDEVGPHIVVTGWPFDTHPNHHATSSLVWQCYSKRNGWNLYLFEVETDVQSLGFVPQLYLDIGSVREAKKAALWCHASQDPEEIWERFHDPMHRRRGRECGVTYAEAYYLVEAKESCPLLPVAFLSRADRDSQMD